MFLDGNVLSLSEFCSRVVAAHIAFEVVEQAWQPVPEPLQLRIAFWSFPDNEEDIRLYSCLANGAADEFNKGENLYKSRAVKEPLQIGNYSGAAASCSYSKSSSLSLSLFIYLFISLSSLPLRLQIVGILLIPPNIK